MRLSTTYGCILTLVGLAMLTDNRRAHGQQELLELLGTPPVALKSADEEQPTIVELTYGQSRQSVLDELGPPELESLIGVLERARVTYENNTELLFKDNRLIAITTPAAVEPTDDGRNSILMRDKKVVFASELILPESEPLPMGDERMIFEDSYYFSPQADMRAPYENHFTPAIPQCLLDDCPGCEHCGYANGVGLEDGCNCYGFGCAMADCWNVRVHFDAVFLHRSDADFNLGFMAGANTTETSILSHGMAPGFQIGTILNLTGTCFVELSYLGLHDWSADGRDENLLTPPDSLRSTGTYDADLDDFQINMIYRREARPWSLHWGVRVSQHEDSFRNRLAGSFNSGPGVVNVNLPLAGHARNRLVGLQAGGEHWWWCGPLQLIVAAKGGVMHNEIDQFGPSYVGSLDLTTFPGPSAPTFVTRDTDITAVGDFEASVRYVIGSHGGVRLGYRGLVFDNLAQVSDQRGRSARAQTLWFNGAFAGAEFRW